jgi:four helix bundle protein
MGNELETRNRNGNTERRTAPRRKGDDIAERLVDLGAAVIKLVPALGRKPGGKTIAKQLERCGPAGGSNYEEARGAESPADFVHKTRIALKEVRETRYWLRLAVRAE